MKNERKWVQNSATEVQQKQQKQMNGWADRSNGPAA